ncbi:MAG: AlbA family DNA-binding domain-containing protein [Nitrososphaerales archaeon]
MELKQKLNITSESEKKGFVKDLPAVANTVTNVGYIVYGVSKENQPLGIKQKPGLDESLIQIGASRIVPAVDFEPIWIETNGVFILTLRVPKSNSRPHWIFSTRDVFVCRNKVVDKAHRDEILAMKRNQKVPIKLHRDVEEAREEGGDIASPVDDKLILNFFPIYGNPTQYRTCNKSGPLITHSPPRSLHART